jgi:hypothetical protein
LRGITKDETTVGLLSVFHGGTMEVLGVRLGDSSWHYPIRTRHHGAKISTEFLQAFSVFGVITCCCATQLAAGELICNHTFLKAFRVHEKHILVSYKILFKSLKVFFSKLVSSPIDTFPLLRYTTILFPPQLTFLV